jgi:hypothetical protein
MHIQILVPQFFPLTTQIACVASASPLYAVILALCATVVLRPFPTSAPIGLLESGHAYYPHPHPQGAGRYRPNSFRKSLEELLISYGCGAKCRAMADAILRLLPASSPSRPNAKEQG